MSVRYHVLKIVFSNRGRTFSGVISHYVAKLIHECHFCQRDIKRYFSVLVFTSHSQLQAANCSDHLCPPAALALATNTIDDRGTGNT